MKEGLSWRKPEQWMIEGSVSKYNEQASPRTSTPPSKGGMQMDGEPQAEAGSSVQDGDISRGKKASIRLHSGHGFGDLLLGTLPT